MALKITSFEAENVKRIKAVQLEPSLTGLTIIGGRNNQGKTSVLDAIAWALGGNKLRPSEPHRSGSMQDPEIRIQLSNGLLVERKGKNSELKVTDPTGKKTGQKILDSLIGEMALNVPRFMEATSKEKADYLLQIIGIGDELAKLEKEESDLFTQRTYTGQQYRAKKAHADQMAEFPDVGTEEISAMDLIQKQQAILLKNAENAKKRAWVEDYKRSLERVNASIQHEEEQLKQLKADRIAILNNLEIAQKDALDLYDESTEELEKSLASIDQTNQRIRINRQKKQALDEAEQLKTHYQSLSVDIDKIRQQRMDLLNGAPLPLPDLRVENGQITYKGQQWDNMSGSDQLKVSAAICRAMNPECGFVLLDKLEQMDQETLQEFGSWMESQGLQAIATRVSTGDECSIIIEDGQVRGQEQDFYQKQEQKWSEAKW